MAIYENLGVKPVINAFGNATVLGGSTIAEKVSDAMMEANDCFVELWELHEKAGAVIAEICGAEAGWVTPGAHAALVFSAAACIGGRDEEKMNVLPNAEGMKNEIIIQACQRYYHDRSMRTAGGNLIAVGDEESCSQKSIESAINEKTAAILYNVYSPKGAVPEKEVVRIGKRHGVPIIIDAAYDCYPLDLFRKHIAMGADLVCYSGKYFGAPNSTGFVVGRKDLIGSVALHSFISRSAACPIGRGYKLDRQEIVGLLVALQSWITMDHKKRIEEKYNMVRWLKSRLTRIHEIKTEDMPDRSIFIGFRITLENKTAEETMELYKEKIYGGDPKIVMRTERNSLVVNVYSLKDGEEKILADRLESVL